MRFLLFLALATQTVTFHAKQWRAEWQPYAQAGARYPAGRWQHVTGKPQWLNVRLWYNEQGKYWEVEEGSPRYWVWTRLFDGDVLKLDDNGFLSIDGLW